LCYSMGH